MIQPCQCLEFFRCIWFNSGYVGLNQPAIHASIADLDMSANIWELGAWRIPSIRCTCHFINHNKEQASRISIWTADMFSGLFPGTPRIASSSAERYFFPAHLELHPHRPHVILLPSSPIIPLNFVPYLYPYILLSTFPNFTSSNMEPMASQVRNHYSQKNQEDYLERALASALQKTANLHCRSNVWTSHPTFQYSVGDS